MSTGPLDQTNAEDEAQYESPCTFIPSALLLGLVSAGTEEGTSVTGGMGMPATVPARFETELPLEAPTRKSIQAGKPNRLVYDLQFCRREDQMPGVLMRAEGDEAINTVGNPSVDQCYDNFGIAYDFFYTIFGRDSIDDQGCPLIGIVNFDFYYPNATWSMNRANLQHVLVFGNGWDNDAFQQGRAMDTFAGMFGGFVGSLEVVVHELMHGITRTEIQLEPYNEAGALDEHLADVFGIMAEQWHKKQTVDEADWLIGEDCVVPQRKGFALRSLSNPGTAYDFELENESFQGFSKDPQVAHYTKRYYGPGDRGGVHINSGILNKAFYLLARKLGGNSWEKAGKIWYAALTSKEVPKNCSIRRWAKHTVDAAQKMKAPGFDESVVKRVTEAWAEVGVEPRW